MPIPDKRLIQYGLEIPTGTYSDQPYVVIADDGCWVCVLTTGAGLEGELGQHVATMRSADRGETWSEPVALEPPEGPESSYAVLLKGPDGRLFCFYNHNTDNLRWVLADDPPFPGGRCARVDSQGHFVFKVSVDHGVSWSMERYEIPQRNMDIDRKNPYGGDIRYFWNVGRAFALNGEAYVPLHKVGGFGVGFFTRSEGVLLHSRNLLCAPDPGTATWETLPDGEYGLSAPAGGGPIAEEQCCVTMSDGSLFCVYRTVDGHAACCYSRDMGHSWSATEYMRYSDGRLMKHPRAANFVWRLANGRYVYWFHNHGWRSYEGRNPVWISGGVERDTPDGKTIAWSEPEILLYDDDILIRMSYPDMIEERDGRIYFTETQKDIARVHEVDRALLEGLWKQGEACMPEDEPLLCAAGFGAADVVDLPQLPAFCARNMEEPDMRMLDLRSGFSLCFALDAGDWRVGEALLDSVDASGAGLRVWMGEDRRLWMQLSDGMTTNLAHSDPVEQGAVRQVAFVVDGGPRIILSVVDGRLSTGGDRPYGWARFSRCMLHCNGRAALKGNRLVSDVRIYGRALRVSEAVRMQRVRSDKRTRGD